MSGDLDAGPESSKGCLRNRHTSGPARSRGRVREQGADHVRKGTSEATRVYSLLVSWRRVLRPRVKLSELALTQS